MTLAKKKFSDNVVIQPFNFGGKSRKRKSVKPRFIGPKTNIEALLIHAKKKKVKL